MLDQGVVEIVGHSPEEEEADDQSDWDDRPLCGSSGVAHRGLRANAEPLDCVILNVFLPTPGLDILAAHEKQVHQRKGIVSRSAVRRLTP